VTADAPGAGIVTIPAIEVARVDTPLGPAVVRVGCQAISATEAFLIDAKSFDVPNVDVGKKIPSHMRVDRAVRIDVWITARRNNLAPRVHFSLDAPSHGGAQPGECLESINFVRGDTSLDLATRDSDWMLRIGVTHGMLPARFRADDACASPNWQIEYAVDGLRILPGVLSAGEAAQCPLALAFVSAPADPATEPRIWPWFAVDVVLP
jgi:hypothetical protein